MRFHVNCLAVNMWAREIVCVLPTVTQGFRLSNQISFVSYKGKKKILVKPYCLAMLYKYTTFSLFNSCDKMLY